ncbi:sporulation protein, YlmC/YmxH family [Alteribacillus persepolensis]|uniref:Sporulation protein, YlmC/YmxH family n=1 Tax=Alteribacillus persepolensis TaxID=568899 RepID=A0A1G7YGH4_9BACI|nr:YlmC/YmxH family sporulation protein [Alteribacillus persepolensis]SDG95477.1 sporulation protein, YlmC/YmxH family [Alteribacillus persepolensis]
MRISDLQSKDIVNMHTGKRLGHAGDVDINVETGQVDAIIVGGAAKMMTLFNREQEFVVPWTQIVKIGSDVILVNLYEGDE